MTNDADDHAQSGCGLANLQLALCCPVIFPTRNLYRRSNAKPTAKRKSMKVLAGECVGSGICLSLPLIVIFKHGNNAASYRRAFSIDVDLRELIT